MRKSGIRKQGLSAISGMTLSILAAMGSSAGCTFNPEVTLGPRDAAVADRPNQDRDASPPDAAPDTGLRDSEVLDSMLWDSRIPDARPLDASGICTGSCDACDNQTQESACGGVVGCHWSPAACGGSCTDCSSLDSGQCSTVSGCSLTTESSCAGSCWQCSDFTDQASCAVQHGCSWAGAHCTGTPNPCNGRTQTDCTNGCTWTLGSCSGGTVTCSSISNSEHCVTVGCTWNINRGQCTNSGPAPECINLLTEQQCTVDSEGQCTWKEGSCDGTPFPCSGRNQMLCTDGCTWVSARCSGTCTPCDQLGDQGSCESQGGCSWQTVSHCVGTCTACSSFGDELSCAGQPGCQWEEAACSGTCQDCDTFRTQATCEAQPGCRWELPHG